MRRALFVTLSLMRPKIDEVISAVGLLNDGLFRTFRASEGHRLSQRVRRRSRHQCVDHWSKIAIQTTGRAEV